METNKVDYEQFQDALKTKVDQRELKALIKRQNNLESFIHKHLNKKGKKDMEVTIKMIEGDDFEESVQEDERPGADVDEMATSPFKYGKKKKQLNHQLYPHNT